jgi:hypothetical protein
MTQGEFGFEIDFLLLDLVIKVEMQLQCDMVFLVTIRLW